MKKNRYNKIRLGIIAVLSFSISVSMTLENYYLPIIFVLSAFAAMHYLRLQLRSETVLADERDYQVASSAARYTLITYSWLGAIGTFILMAISKKQGSLYDLSLFLAFSVCFLLLLNAFLFKYLIKKTKIT